VEVACIQMRRYDHLKTVTSKFLGKLNSDSVRRRCIHLI
jgi:hypothetical protein